MPHRTLCSIDEFMLEKDGFLENPGCDPDLEDLEAVMGVAAMSAQELLSAWFDAEIRRMRGRTQLTIHRHMTVMDFDEFVSHAAADGELGDHWSEDADTWSHYSDALGSNIRISGMVTPDQVDWHTTFQRRLAFPSEREIVILGSVAVTSITNLDDDRIWEPTYGSEPAAARMP